MHETLRRRILRRLDTLPEAQLYQVLDYIEFLESRYGERGVPSDATGLQRLAERLEDGLRKRTLNPSNLREAFQLISVADRVIGSVSEAGRQILDDFQGSFEEPDPGGPGAGRGTGKDSADPEARAARNAGGSRSMPGRTASGGSGAPALAPRPALPARRPSSDRPEGEARDRAGGHPGDSPAEDAGDRAGERAGEPRRGRAEDGSEEASGEG